MEKKEKRTLQNNTQLKRKRVAATTLMHMKRNDGKSMNGEVQPLRRLHIADDDDESNEEEFQKQFTHATKFQLRNKTMPKFNNAPRVLSTFNPPVPQPRKIPPKPPQRKSLSFVRQDPEGGGQMAVVAEFHERKFTSQLAVVQQTLKIAREPLKPAININQQHLLHQSGVHSMSPNSHATHNPNNNLIFGTLNVQQRQMLQLPHLQQQKQQQLVHCNMNVMRNSHNQSHNMMVENGAEKSDPENHIYEMIDEYEVNGKKIQQQQAIRANEGEEVTKHDLFQNLLQTEMMNQMRLCRSSGNGISGGFLSHLTQEKRMDILQETALALASAAYIEKAAQRMVSAANGTKSSRSHNSDRGGFCGAIQRAPPPIPASLARRMSNKENLGFGRVKVMLRVSDSPPTTVDGERSASHLSIDKKKRQVTLCEPSSGQGSSQNQNQTQDRGPMVSAPKMFAFDALHTSDDSQIDVCASALTEVIPAVLDGSDGCLLAIGYPAAGQNRTMLGSVASANDLGAIPCAISWLYKGINEKRQKSGARFSVRVSALGINATKPGSSAKDLLASLATESDESPGIYLKDDYLGGPTELRAPTAERAALFLDAALAGRTSNIYESALIFTLHVYQYSLGAGKGGVAGGRSRLHLIDLGGCANRNGGLPLSSVGNVVLSILSGQRHPPNREHPLTPLLKDCLAPLTCHVAIIAHVAYTQTHADSLTTIQLASRIHRLRRRKHRFPLSGDKSSSGNAQSGSSSGPDPSSSDFSADTVIYVGPSLDDATDNEHPPVFLPNLNSGDNRCAMNKVLRGSAVEKNNSLPKSPIKKPNIIQKSQNSTHQKSDSLKRNQAKHLNESTAIAQSPTDHTIYAQVVPSGSTKINSLKHSSVSKASNFPTPKSSPMRKNPSSSNQESSPNRLAEEKWIDGPRVSKYKVAEARHLMREINHIKKCETWIDGPNIKPQQQLLTQGSTHSSTQSYGFMDSHKKKMIRQWVENQTCQIFHQVEQVNATPVQYHTYYKSQSQQMQQPQKAEIMMQRNEDDRSSISSRNDEFVNPLSQGLNNLPTATANYSESAIKTGLKQQQTDFEHEIQSERSISNISESRLQYMATAACGEGEEEDQDSGPSDLPPALPLIDPLGSREVSRHVSRESINVMMMDCALQVTEDDIAKAMGGEHPLSALSNGDISVVSSFNVGDTFSECILGDSGRNQMDQLARLRELFNSQLAMAEVIPAFRIDTGSVYSEPAYRFNAGPGSVASEPVYRASSPRCRDCRQSISRTPSQTSLPSLNGIVAIAGMEPYSSLLRHPDGASDPNIKKSVDNCEIEDKIEIHIKENPLAEICETDLNDKQHMKMSPLINTHHSKPHLPLLPISTPPEAYDSGHDSTPRASKHSGISRRAESGYHSVATVRDSDESSFSSQPSSRPNQNVSNSKNEKNEKQASSSKKKSRQDKSLCQWLRNPFTCTYPDTEGDVSDF
ncbi:hypothetical protein PVAND_006014 [Polypedilum vanderplanki]|uniref:Kinesin motor domain-containing protein n=1 Tax=Polypedilum vanderplanki TaxID=319348 RepID=A0A9J6C2Q8_POLVA|nr:hypothetical protein PVAND_006014 [Polypedilum vanderplanki]